MPIYRADQLSRSKHASSDCGNLWGDSSAVTVTANLTTADEIILMEVPAGVRLDELRFRNDDCDTGTTLTMNIGYRSVHPDKTVGDAFTAFASASTAFQSANAAWQELVFAPILLQEPVVIVLRPQANATGISGTPTIRARARGQVVGVI